MGFSSSPRSCTHHVFLNFRGEDTRKGFTDHLCAALERKGIRTFRDDKNLEKGENLAEAFKRAIEESMFAITIISPDYASSSWCLNELQRIVECSKNKGLEIVTIFYNVEPTDARNQEGSFKASFEEHKKRPDREKKIQPWKEALQHISNCSDWVFKDQNEAIFVESIAEHIFKKLIPKLPSSTQNMVGVTPRVKQVIRHLGVEVKDDVRFVGILGMGGLGKTTIARAVFELIRGEFKFSCFVRNVRELSETKGFVHLQKIILSSLNVSNCDFSDEEDGKNIIKFSSCNKKVLLVLDDINDETQLKNLAGKQDWFGPGSRIIITTRDLNLLQRHRVQGTYKLKGLNLQSASRVFCLYAFENGKPYEEYSELCKKVVKYAQGLPLALEVLGSYLYGKKVDFWQDTIRELSTAPHSKIHKALKISYDHLLPAEKNIFLDIACFFKGWSKSQVISILKICNVYVGIGSEIGSGIANLIDKSLLTLNQNDELEMHDLLQEMGRHIVHEESQETPKDPGKRSRLWFKDDIDHVLTTDTGSDAIQGIALSSYHEAYWSPGAFLKDSSTEVSQTIWHKTSQWSRLSSKVIKSSSLVRMSFRNSAPSRSIIPSC